MRYSIWCRDTNRNQDFKLEQNIQDHQLDARMVAMGKVVANVDFFHGIRWEVDWLEGEEPHQCNCIACNPAEGVGTYHVDSGEHQDI